MNTIRRDTPRATPLVLPHPRPRFPPQRGTVLTGNVELLVGTETFELAVGDGCVLGRDQACAVVLNDPLSRRHVEIVVSARCVDLLDLGSTNGVYINGERVDVRALVRAGDQILLGTTEVFLFPAKLVARHFDRPSVTPGRCRKG